MIRVFLEKKMDGITKFVISISVLFAILIVGLTTSMGLHAGIPQSEFFVPPNEDIYECRLQWIHENHNEQFLLGEKRLLTCVYKCKDVSGTFRWLDKSWDEKGCKINSRVYKTEIGR